MARKALIDGLVRYDEAHGWHGVVKVVDLGQDWGVALGEIPEFGDIKPWRLAVALDVTDTSIRVGLQPDARVLRRPFAGPPDRERSISPATNSPIDASSRS